MLTVSKQAPANRHGVMATPRVTYVAHGGNYACGICGSVLSYVATSLYSEKRLWIFHLALAIARKRYHRRKEETCMDQPRDYAIQLTKLPDRIAAIIAKTYVVMGDAFEIEDNIALEMIKDRLEEMDETLIERNKNKRLNRR
jgi:hypothetical protein